MKRPAYRRWYSLGPAAVSGVFVLIVLVALWFSGLVDLSRLGFGAKASTAGLTAVPVSAARIPAYTKITRDQLWDPKAGSFAATYLPPKQVTPEMLTNLRDILGRVLDHDKPAGYI